MAYDPSYTVATRRAEFARAVHGALAHMHDPIYLQAHALTKTFAPPEGTSATRAGQLLRQALLDAIESLRPGPGIPTDSDSWRRYQVISLHYGQGLDSQTVQDRLVISQSTYYREQRRGLEAVVALLEDQFLPEIRGKATEEHDAAIGTPSHDAGGSPLAPPAPRSNLPAHLTTFIGRTKDVAEIARLLSMSRLVTLTGIAGCGKTRLAEEAALAVRDDFAEGVWLVDLAGLADPALVAWTVAAAMGIRGEADQPILTILVTALRPQRRLLVLDNCEHVIDACALLVTQLLQECPLLRVLATSRQNLRITGEVIVHVPPLAIPPGGNSSAARIAHYDAVRLFIDRATAVQPAFKLTEQQAPAVAQLCRRLDGLPLAIELAAARVKVLTPEQIVSRLDEPFRLLTGGSRAARPRQQTLRALIDWSYDLLTEEESLLFNRLSVFVGGWTLEAAEAVCSLPATPASTEEPSDSEPGQIPLVPLDVLDLLAQLADKSLVLVEDRGKEARYRLLETLREYAHEKLVASGESEVLQSRHRDWFLGLAERAWTGLHGHGEVAWLDQLDVEHDNLRAALAWSQLGVNDPEAALRFASALTFLWMTHGYMMEGQTLLGAVQAPASASHSSVVWARALWGASVLAYYRGELATARSLGERALALRRTLGEAQSIVQSLKDLGLTAREQGDFAAGRAFLEEAVSSSRETQDDPNVAVSLDRLGTVLHAAGDFAGARAMYEESFAMWERLGDKSGCAWSLFNQGCLAFDQGDYQSARTLLRSSLVLRRIDGHRPGLLRLFEAIASLASMEGQSIRAARLAGAASALREAFGLRQLPTSRARLERPLDIVRRALGEHTFLSSWAEGQSLTLEEAILEAMDERALA